MMGTAHAAMGVSSTALFLFDGWVRRLTLGGIIVSVVNTLLRKQLPDLVPEFLTCASF